MAYKSCCFLILTFSLVCLSVNCFPNNRQINIHQNYEQGVIGHSSLNRFRRQSPVSGYKNYMPAAAQPSVVVVPNGGPQNYRGLGSTYGVSSFGVQSIPYGSQGGYGVNRAPTVVVNMPDSSSCSQKKKKKKKILS